MQIPLSDAAPGMVLSRDVLNLHGQRLLAQGTVLDAGGLKVLRLWGVKVLSVRQPGSDDDSRQAAALDRNLIEQAAVIERPRFRLCDLGRPHLHALFTLAVKSRAQRLARARK